MPVASDSQGWTQNGRWSESLPDDVINLQPLVCYYSLNQQAIIINGVSPLTMMAKRYYLESYPVMKGNIRDSAAA